MRKYVGVRIPGLLLTLLTITCVIMYGLVFVPGDPVSERLGNGDLYFLEKDANGYNSYLDNYAQEASNFYFDVPKLPLSLSPAYFVDSMESVWPLSTRRSVKEWSSFLQNKKLTTRSLYVFKSTAFSNSDSVSLDLRKLCYSWLNNQWDAEQMHRNLMNFPDSDGDKLWKLFLNSYKQEFASKPDGTWLPRIRFHKENALFNLFWKKNSDEGWLRLNFGKSSMDGRSVWSHFNMHIWPTVRLSLFSIFISLCLGTLLAIQLHKIKWKGFEVLVNFVYVVPLFVLAALIVSLLSNSGAFTWLEFYGEEEFIGHFSDIITFFKYLTLPAFIMAVPLSIFVGLNLRDRIAEQYTREYVRSARSRGVPEKNILWKHVWPNVRPYYLGFIGLLIPGIITGSVIIEFIFARNGMGQFFLQSTFHKDISSILFLVWVIGIFQFIGNSISDLLIAKADKRVRS